MINQNLIDKIDLFFNKPSSSGIHPTTYSHLHLARRHINICLCIDPAPPIHTFQAIWPAAMAILAGIDLLSLYRFGGSKSSNKKFIEFCEKYLDLKWDDGETIYMFRNALIHTYGLYSVNEINSSSNYNNTYKFKVVYDESINWLIEPSTSVTGTYCINLHELYKKFESAIYKYHSDVKIVPICMQNFEDKFDELGIITYG